MFLHLNSSLIDIQKTYVNPITSHLVTTSYLYKYY